jgi:hypothetical protein
VYEEREDEEGGAKSSLTYGFRMLATRPVLDSFGKTSRSHKGASRLVFLLSETLPEAVQGIG